MKTERNILIAFLLNLCFSIVEIFGGLYTGSVAILSDAVHDLGDAASIGVSYFLERKSKGQPDETHTYGYGRYSVLGGVITTVILLVGSILVIVHAVEKIIRPTPVKYDGMIAFAVFGVMVNFLAAYVTREGDSINQKAVNLHMLEDVLGWAVVLVGAIVMKFTDFVLIDPLMSIAVAAFIFVNAFKTLKEVLDLFLAKTPQGIDIGDLKSHVMSLAGVEDVHHVHIWSLDGHHHFATMHVVTDQDPQVIKQAVREELQEHGISHVTIETERSGDECPAHECHIDHVAVVGHHHHHH